MGQPLTGPPRTEGQRGAPGSEREARPQTQAPSLCPRRCPPPHLAVPSAQPLKCLGCPFLPCLLLCLRPRRLPATGTELAPLLFLSAPQSRLNDPRRPQSIPTACLYKCPGFLSRRSSRATPAPPSLSGSSSETVLHVRGSRQPRPRRGLHQPRAQQRRTRVRRRRRFRPRPGPAFQPRRGDVQPGGRGQPHPGGPGHVGRGDRQCTRGDAPSPARPGPHTRTFCCTQQ